MSMQPVDRRSSDDVQDRSAIEAVVSGLERTWVAGNGQAWASYFAEEADFTVWFGLYLRGRDAIAAAHQQIFDSFYKNTKLRLDVRDLRFLRRVAVFHNTKSTVAEHLGKGGCPEVTAPAIHLCRRCWLSHEAAENEASDAEPPNKPMKLTFAFGVRSLSASR